MDLKTGDIVYIESYKVPDWPSVSVGDSRHDFFCEKHFRELRGMPTRIFTAINGDLYVTHPTLDLVPFDETCVNFEKLEGITIDSHRETKEMLQMFQKLGVKKIPKKSIKNMLNKKLNEQQEERKLTPGDQKLIELIQDVKRDDSLDPVIRTFGNPENLIKILNRRNLLDYIDPFDWPWEIVSNDLFYYRMQKDPNFYKKIADKYFTSDVIKLGEDYYLKTDGSILQKFFKRSREFKDSFIEQVLDCMWDDMTDYDYYHELNPIEIYDMLGNAQTVVDNKIFLELSSRSHLDVTSDTPDLFDEIMNDQSNEGEIELTDNAIQQIMNDDESIKYLIDNEFIEIKNNLKLILSNCQNEMIYHRYRKKLFAELIKHNIIDSESSRMIPNPSAWYPEAKVEVYKITNSLKKQIEIFLNADMRKRQGDVFNDFSFYTGFVRNNQDNAIELPHFDEEPSYRDVESCMRQKILQYF